MKIRWTWKKIAEALTAKGYSCVKIPGRRHGHYYEITNAQIGYHANFDTVGEVRYAFGFYEDNGEAE